MVSTETGLRALACDHTLLLCECFQDCARLFLRSLMKSRGILCVGGSALGHRWIVPRIQSLRLDAACPERRVSFKSRCLSSRRSRLVAACSRPRGRTILTLCCLTFELSGRRRQDARPGLVKMYRVPPAGRWWPAVGAPLERRVRPHRRLRTGARMQTRSLRHGAA